MPSFKIFLSELLIFIIAFIGLNKLFFALEVKYAEPFVKFATGNTFFSILIILLIISFAFSEYLFRKNKGVIKPIKFMQTDKKLAVISLKKLLVQKEGLIFIGLVITFYLTYNNIIKFNNYSMQILLIILIFYCPLSTIKQIKKERQKHAKRA